MPNDQNNLVPHVGPLPEVLGDPADGLTPTPEVHEHPTDWDVAPEAVRRLQQCSLRVLVAGEDKPRKWDISREVRQKKCCIRVPSCRKTGNMEVFRFAIDNALYVRQDVWDTIKNYPDTIEYDGKVYRKAGPRSVKFYARIVNP